MAVFKRQTLVRMVDNYKEINAEAEIKNSQSIFHFYKRMIAFRQKSPYTDILLYGTFEGLSNLPDNVIAYKRKLNEKTIYAFLILVRQFQSLII